jgi:3',5'-cyclic AMP phosphodiesterase CpdA
MPTAPPPPDPNAIHVLFRYRDLVAATVDEHRKILTAHGRVWWGWWKRPGERDRMRIWTFLREMIDQHGFARVGLFNSGDSDPRTSVRVARVSDIRFPKDDGSVVELPEADRELVPGYYRASPFSRAWMQLDAIDDKPIDFFGKYSYEQAPPLPGYTAESLKRLEGKVVLDPEELRAMDTTIWRVRPARGSDATERLITASMSVTDPVSDRPILCRGDTILHLSDPHFATGAMRRQHVWRLETEDPDGNDTLVDAIVRAVGKRRIGILLVTGDFTFSGTTEEFEEARVALSRLAGTLGLGTEHLVIVPGNHDIRWTRDANEVYDPKQTEVEVKNAPEAARANYATFYAKLLQHTPNNQLSMARRYILPHGAAVEIGALNSSSLEHGKKYLSGMGRIQGGGFSDVANKLGWDVPGSMALRVLALHHHLVSPSVEDPAEYYSGFGMAIDAPRTQRDAAQRGVHVAVHGHKHRPFMWRSRVYQPPEETAPNYSVGNVSIIGGGSAGSVDTVDKNNFLNLITVSSERLSVEIFRCHDKHLFGPEAMATWHAPFSLEGGRLMLGDWDVKKD